MKKLISCHHIGIVMIFLGFACSQLNTSSLLCDCHVSWLPRWLDTSVYGRSPDHSVVLTCAHPLQLHGRLITDVQQSDFTCGR